MSRGQVALEIAEKIGGDHLVITKHLRSLLSEITDTLTSGENVDIRGFGSFRVASKPPRLGRDPRNGNTIKLKAQKNIVFKASSTLKKRVNEGEYIMGNEGKPETHTGRSKKLVIRLSMAEHKLVTKASQRVGASIAGFIRWSASQYVLSPKGLPDLPFKNEKSTMILLTHEEKERFLCEAAQRGLTLEGFLRLTSSHMAATTTNVPEETLVEQIGKPAQRKKPTRTPALARAQQASKERFAHMRESGLTPRRGSEQSDKVKNWMNSMVGKPVTTQGAADATGASIHLVRDIFSALKKKSVLQAAKPKGWILLHVI